MKKIGVFLYNCISVIVIILVKIILGILAIPAKALKWLLEVAAGLVNLASWGIALIFLIMLIESIWPIHNFSDIFTAVNLLILGVVLFFASGPFWITVLLMWLLEHLEEFYLEVLLDIPITYFTVGSFKTRKEVKEIYRKIQDGQFEEYVPESEESYFGKKQEEQYEQSSADQEPILAEENSSWFVGAKTETEIKKRYHDLLKIYHPDNQAGDTTASQQIQKEYDKLIKSF